MEIIRVNNTKDKDAWLLFEKTYNEIENKEFFAFDKEYTPPKDGFTYKIFDNDKLVACFLLTVPHLDEENLGYD
ncbi:hypothetical protein, partial [Bullifex sp.]|uniref:hypothetical protein n=1 Tax=Bullifex sp. TaxID=2815808 RepID=UPI002A83E138